MPIIYFKLISISLMIIILMTIINSLGIFIKRYRIVKRITDSENMFQKKYW